jgi:ribulose-bisphosphate carboxylase large chain
MVPASSPTENESVHLALHATFQVRSTAQLIAARARAVAIEQSVEMPVSAIDDERVLAEIVGEVEAIDEIGSELFEVRIALAAESVSRDPGQLLNVLFGNSSLHEDVVLHNVELPHELAMIFGGPQHGVAAIRARVGAGVRALTCSALKPQGLVPSKLAELACRLAQGGIDYIKDDHALADQAYAPFAARVQTIMASLGGVERADGRRARYVPNLWGDLDAMRRQIAIARDWGVVAVLIAPVIAGFSNTHRLIKEHPDIIFFAHPAMAGAARIAPPLLFGKLFRMIGADAIIFPNYGGRFGYSAQTCRQLASTAVAELHGMRASMPVPAGGMSMQRIGEMLDFYGADTMLLIGGGLLEAREHLLQATTEFVAAVESYHYG